MRFKGKSLNTSLLPPAINSILLCRHRRFGVVISGFSIKGRQKNCFLPSLLTAHLAAYTCRYSKQVGAKFKTGKKNHFFYVHMQILSYLKVNTRSILTIYPYRMFSVNAVMLKLSHPQTSIFPSRTVLLFFAQNPHYYHGFERP